jgi:hypothetical protein
MLNSRHLLFFAGKSRRLTFIEVPNDLGSMIDTAKVADLVLLMIDGSFGFEMVGPKSFERLRSRLTTLYPRRKPLRRCLHSLRTVFPSSLPS